MKEVLKGIIRTAMDSLKDAEMQIGYAEGAKAEAKTDIALRHIEEAKRRLQGVKEWYDIGMKMSGNEVNPVSDMLMEYHKRLYRDLVDKVATFKPGA